MQAGFHEEAGGVAVFREVFNSIGLVVVPAPSRPLWSSRVSLGGLRRRIEALLLPDDPIIVLQLDPLAERERHRQALPPPTRTR